jgi:hypothetical protein
VLFLLLEDDDEPKDEREVEAPVPSWTPLPVKAENCLYYNLMRVVSLLIAIKGFILIERRN